MPVRKKSKTLVSTYVAPKSTKAGLRYGVRIIDGQTRQENRCSRETLREGVECAREKIGLR